MKDDILCVHAVVLVCMPPHRKSKSLRGRRPVWSHARSSERYRALLTLFHVCDCANGAVVWDAAVVRRSGRPRADIGGGHVTRPLARLRRARSSRRIRSFLLDEIQARFDIVDIIQIVQIVEIVEIVFPFFCSPFPSPPVVAPDGGHRGEAQRGKVGVVQPSGTKETVYSS